MFIFLLSVSALECLPFPGGLLCEAERRGWGKEQTPAVPPASTQPTRREDGKTHHLASCYPRRHLLDSLSLFCSAAAPNPHRRYPRCQRVASVRARQGLVLDVEVVQGLVRGVVRVEPEAQGRGQEEGGPGEAGHAPGHGQGRPRSHAQYSRGGWVCFLPARRHASRLISTEALCVLPRTPYVSRFTCLKAMALSHPMCNFA